MISLHDLIDATSGRLHGRAEAQQFSDFAFDSRRLDDPPQAYPHEHGPLFVAVRSATGDGHDYVIEAVHRGATGVLCQRVPAELPDGVTCLVVEDTRQALLDWAGHILRKYGTEVIAVTGSSGKTATKEAIAAVLSTRYSTFRNYGTYSGRYGLPIALGRLQPAHAFAVLELAADSVDEVRDLAALICPRMGVITVIHRAHVDSLGSIEAVEREKSHLAAALPGDGTVFLNRDDPRVWAMRYRSRAEVVSFGFHPDAEYRAAVVEQDASGLRLELFHQTSRLTPARPLAFGWLGAHHAYVALAALAVGQHNGVPVAEALAALEELRPLPGRLNAVQGRNGAILLDDSYDADLASTLAALQALREHYPSRQRIAVLGSLRGQTSVADAYRQVGEQAAHSAHSLVLKGEQASLVREAALSAGLAPSRVFETFANQEAVRHLEQNLEPGSVVLVKGSRDERMEEITRDLMSHPVGAPAQLVRQENVYRSVQFTLPQRPTWLEVDLGAIRANLCRIRQLLGDEVDVMVVLKADGYGHGATRIARTSLNNGARMLGVACLSEAAALRQAGIGAPILILGYTPAWQARETMRSDITATVFDLETMRAFATAARDLGRTAHVHVKVDTGMGRLGLLPHDVLPVLRQAIELPGLSIEGIFTHFSLADEADKSYTCLQLQRFQDVLHQLENAGIHIPLVHAANSAAMLSMSQARYNMVRVGIALYGLAPSQAVPLPDGFRQALAFKTRIAQVKLLPPGSFVSYGNTYQTQGDERIAVIPVGYADGFRRAPSHWGEVLVRGQRAPIVGRVCMDQTMLNVTHIPEARQGDQVVLIGRQGDDEITVEEVAGRLDTINYEVVSEILARVPRVSW
jgi:alanine racemase